MKTITITVETEEQACLIADIVQTAEVGGACEENTPLDFAFDILKEDAEETLNPAFSPEDDTLVKVSRNTIIDNEAKHQLERVVRPNPEP